LFCGREFFVGCFHFFFAIGGFHFFKTLVRRQQSGPGANVHSFQSRRLRNFFRRIARQRGVHHIHPDGEGNIVAEGAAINFLRLIESRPNRAGDRAVVAGKKHVGKIVGRAGLAARVHFFEAKFRARGFACSAVQRIDQTGMDFKCDLGREHFLLFVPALRVPDRAIFLFDFFQNVSVVWPPAAVREDGVGQRQFSEGNFTASKKCCRKWAQRRFDSGRATELHHIVHARIHSEANSCSVLRFHQCLPRGDRPFVTILRCLRSPLA